MALHPELATDVRFACISDWEEYVVRVYDAQTLGEAANIDGVTTPTGIFCTERRHETFGL